MPEPIYAQAFMDLPLVVTITPPFHPTILMPEPTYAQAFSRLATSEPAPFAFLFGRYGGFSQVPGTMFAISITIVDTKPTTTSPF